MNDAKTRNDKETAVAVRKPPRPVTTQQPSAAGKTDTKPARARIVGVSKPKVATNAAAAVPSKPVVVARPAAVVADPRLDVLEALKRAGLTLESCPDDYERLRDEAVFCSRLSAYAFFVMARRLVRIRDERLYATVGGYEHFVAFLEAELAVTPKTAFNYMALLDHFGDAAIIAHPDLEYSKLLPALPLLKAAGDERAKQQIRRAFLQGAGAMTREELKGLARNLADRLGLEDVAPHRPDSKFVLLAERLIEAIPKRPTKADRLAATRVMTVLAGHFG